MRQALHIFRKDSRQYRYLIAILLVWTAALAMANAQSWPTSPRPDFGWGTQVRHTVMGLTTFLLPALWWLTISLVFHAEPLPGDRQFWVTRPYDRLSLFTAKALFVLAYILVPIAIAQGVSIVLNGLPLTPNLGGLVWELVLILVVLVLPAATIASLTATLTQFVIAALTLPVAAWIAFQTLPHWGALSWIRTSTAVLGIVMVTAPVLLRQFRYRRTSSARRTALAGTLLVMALTALLPWPAAFILQSRLAAAPGLTLTAQVERAELHPSFLASGASPSHHDLHLGFVLDGLATGTRLRCEATDLTVEDSRGRRWRSGVERPSRSSLLWAAPFACGTNARIPSTFIEAAADDPVKVRALLYVSVLGPEQETSLTTGAPAVAVPGLGWCAAATGGDVFGVITCRDAFRQGDADVDIIRNIGPSYSPFPADLRLNPVLQYSGAFPGDVTTTALTVREPVAHVRVVVHEREVSLPELLVSPRSD
jgi:hypothetical protein